MASRLNRALDARIQRAVLEHHVAAELVAGTIYPVHGSHRVEYAEERDATLLVFVENQASELARQGGAAAVAEQGEGVAGLVVRLLEVGARFGQDAARVGPCGRERHVQFRAAGRVQPAQERYAPADLQGAYAVVVEAALRIAAGRLGGRMAIQAAAHEDVQLQDVGDALVLLEAADIAGLVARAVEAEHQCLAVFRGSPPQRWRQ